MLGIIEGFYGRPWSYEERVDTFAWMARRGFDTYVYAPKSDLRLRGEWRQSADFSDLLALRLAAQKHRIAFGVGFSPLRVGSDDKPAMRSMVQRLKALDLDVLAVLFDDMRGDSADLAITQLYWLNYLQSQNVARRYILCPTYYSFDPVLPRVFGAMPDGYWRELGEGLSQAVDYFWTGPEVCSERLTQDDIAEVSQLMGRSPVMWDNYPVNDGRLLSRYLNIFPPPKRAMHSFMQCAGYLYNPMNQCHLSRVALAGDLFDITCPDKTLRANLVQFCSSGLAERIWQDRDVFQYLGLDRMSLDYGRRLRRVYGAYNEPVAAEICSWLDGFYRFDPNCLTD